MLFLLLSSLLAVPTLGFSNLIIII